MRWEKPVVEEMNVSLTANGLFDTTFETVIFYNDSDKSKPDEKTPESGS